MSVSVENHALSLANTGLLPGPAGQLPSALICSSTPSGQVSANSLPLYGLHRLAEGGEVGLVERQPVFLEEGAKLGLQRS
jgi:hypothetical protein